MALNSNVPGTFVHFQVTFYQRV